MDDLVSRQAVLELIKKSILPEEYGCRLLYQSVEQMPSVQTGIIRCKDCSKWHTVHCPFFSKYITVMSNEEQYCSYAERRTDDERRSNQLDN